MTQGGHWPDSIVDILVEFDKYRRPASFPTQHCTVGQTLHLCCSLLPVYVLLPFNILHCSGSVQRLYFAHLHRVAVSLICWPFGQNVVFNTTSCMLHSIQHLLSSATVSLTR